MGGEIIHEIRITGVCFAFPAVRMELWAPAAAAGVCVYLAGCLGQGVQWPVWQGCSGRDASHPGWGIPCVLGAVGEGVGRAQGGSGAGHTH